MGSQSNYRNEGGFSQYLYKHGDIIREGNLQAKVIYKDGTKNYKESLPPFSNTSDMYFGLKKDKDTGKTYIDQLRFYKDRKAYMDFDWGHEHVVKEGGKVVKRYPAGVVHVQCFKIVDGHPVRDGNKVRLLNNAEIKKYGSFLKKAYPNIRFRPPRKKG